MPAASVVVAQVSCPYPPAPQESHRHNTQPSPASRLPASTPKPQGVLSTPLPTAIQPNTPPARRVPAPGAPGRAPTAGGAPGKRRGGREKLGGTEDQEEAGARGVPAKRRTDGHGGQYRGAWSEGEGAAVRRAVWVCVTHAPCTHVRSPQPRTAGCRAPCVQGRTTAAPSTPGPQGRAPYPTTAPLPQCTPHTMLPLQPS